MTNAAQTQTTFKRKIHSKHNLQTHTTRAHIMSMPELSWEHNLAANSAKTKMTLWAEKKVALACEK